MTYIHELDNWPQFTWGTGHISSILADAYRKQGILYGKMQGVGFELHNQATLENLSADIITSSAIEGEALSKVEVRSSVARRLGMQADASIRSSKKVDGIVQVTIDAIQDTSKLTKDRLFGWHAALFPTGYSGMSQITIGAWRTAESGDMQVVSGAFGKEKVHFTAPGASKIEQEMDTFLKWLNNDGTEDIITKAAIAHFLFITIHPFEDGNGRLARAISDMVLAKADAQSGGQGGNFSKFYSVSTQILKDRSNYYNQLEASQCGTLDITAWLEWFIKTVIHAIDGTDELLAGVLYKHKIWQRIHSNGVAINERQRKVVNKLLDGFNARLTTSKYGRVAKCSQDTALRDIRKLIDAGILKQDEGGGRSTSYSVVA